MVKHFPATEQYPQGYSDVIMGDSLMRVPGEISKNVGRNGAFSVFALWPEFLISQDKRKKMWKSSGIQRNFDTVHIYINPPRRGQHENEAHIIGQEYKIRRSQFIRSLEGQWLESKEFPGYWEILNANGKPRYYKSMDHSVITPFNLPVIFYCTTTNLDINWETYTYKNFEGKFPPQCGISSKWPDGHSLQMSFMRKGCRSSCDI